VTILAEQSSVAPTTIAVAEAVRAPQGRGVAGKAVASVAYSVGSVVVLIGVWWLFLVAFSVDRYIGRRPLDVWRYLTSASGAAANRSLIYHGSIVTIRDAFIGLGVGLIAALVGAVLFTLSRAAQQTFMPMAMVLQSVPLVALVPLIALIFGRSTAFVAIVASIVTFFPALVNVTLAARNAPAQSMDLVHAYGGGKWASLRRVQLPYSLPALFASIRIAAPLAFVGALLAEWLGTADGLGGLMSSGPPQGNFDQVWACAAAATAFSVILYGIISAIETTVLARYGALSN
jgi:ABC-type nitrate/sulfonate/bicarbonate transport system permease component